MSGLKPFELCLNWIPLVVSVAACHFGVSWMESSLRRIKVHSSVLICWANDICCFHCGFLWLSKKILLMTFARQNILLRFLVFIKESTTTWLYLECCVCEIIVLNKHHLIMA